MKTAIRKFNFVARIAWIVGLIAISHARGQSAGSVVVNQNAFAFASQLIQGGQLITDGKGGWREHKPSLAMENEFIRVHGFAEYAKWHLGVDERFAVNTKRRYKFPYGDFKNVHRCGLLAVKARAAEYKYHDIADAAARLIQMNVSAR
jgi:hypothetical protein